MSENKKFNFRHWSEMAPPLAKDEAMPRTEEYFEKALAMDAELIHEMKDEIAELKSKVNRLEQKLVSKKSDNGRGQYVLRP